jgi:hypothetical protein
MPRGGRREGTPGKAYSNRSDLNAGSKPMAPTAVPGQPYGAAGAQLAAQQALPMQGTPTPPPLPTQQPAPSVFAGDHGDFHRPTERPGEPVTTGLAVGAGPGPEILPTQASSAQTVGQFLSTLAALPNAPSDIVALAQMAARRT